MELVRNQIFTFPSNFSLWPRKKAETTTTGDSLLMLTARKGLAGDSSVWREIWGLAGDQGLWREISRHLAGGGNAAPPDYKTRIVWWHSPKKRNFGIRNFGTPNPSFMASSLHASGVFGHTMPSLSGISMTKDAHTPRHLGVKTTGTLLDFRIRVWWSGPAPRPRGKGVQLVQVVCSDFRAPNCSLLSLSSVVFGLQSFV